MRVGVIKIGSRISFNSKDSSGGNGEARAIIKMLHIGGCEVHIFTKLLSKDKLVPEYAWHNISNDTNTSGLNALVILNGNLNFFGGAEDKEQLLNYKMINEFKGPVYYIYCDPELTLKQCWQSVEKKPWTSNWSKDQLFISRSDITYICQPFDTTKVKESLKGAEVIPKNIVHYPLEQFPLINSPLSFNPDTLVDLSYGGTMRGGKRMKKMVKFYFGHHEDISVEMFGKIELADFKEKLIAGLRAPSFSGTVKYDDMLSKMNTSKCHCAIGDPFYEEIGDLPQRIYESINSSVVTFVDSELDVRKRVYGHDDFLYVSSKEELSEKILKVKRDIFFRNSLVKEQFERVNFDCKKYCSKFATLIGV